MNELDSPNLNIRALKRTFNMLAKKHILEENEVLSAQDITIIESYDNQTDLWSLYNLSQNKFTSFREMILSI